MDHIQVKSEFWARWNEGVADYFRFEVVSDFHVVYNEDGKQVNYKWAHVIRCEKNGEWIFLEDHSLKESFRYFFSDYDEYFSANPTSYSGGYFEARNRFVQQHHWIIRKLIS